MDNPLYFSEPFSHCQAWIDLLLIANHKPGFFYSRGIKVDILRGQIGFGSEALAKRWKWSRGKVLRFLKQLETDGQIVQQKNNVTNLISIKNYNQYQNDSTADGTTNSTPNDTADSTADGHKQEVLKNDNKNKKGRKLPTAPTTDFNLIKKIFLEHPNSENYYFNGIDGRAIKDIIQKLKTVIEKSGKNSDISSSFKFLLDNITDKWILDHWSLKNINGQFNEIVNTIKRKFDGKGTNQFSDSKYREILGARPENY